MYFEVLFAPTHLNLGNYFFGVATGLYYHNFKTSGKTFVAKTVRVTDRRVKLFLCELFLFAVASVRRILLSRDFRDLNCIKFHILRIWPRETFDSQLLSVDCYEICLGHRHTSANTRRVPPTGMDLPNISQPRILQNHRKNFICDLHHPHVCGQTDTAQRSSTVVLKRHEHCKRCFFLIWAKIFNYSIFQAVYGLAACLMSGFLGLLLTLCIDLPVATICNMLDLKKGLWILF